MCRKDLNKWLTFATTVTLLWIVAAFGQNSSTVPPEIRHVGAVNVDGSLRCIRAMTGKRALIQSAVDLKWRIEPCPTSHSALEDLMNRDGLRLLDAGEFMYVIPSEFFPPLPAGRDAHWPQVKWRQVKISRVVKPAEGMTQEEANDVARMILERARLIPLDVDFNKTGTVLLELNVFLYQVRLSPASPLSILAWMNQLPNGSAGRFVYGEIQADKYVTLWDSPLFNGVGNPQFEDVDGDGIKEIVMQSHLCGNGCEDKLVIFDRNGRELTRQQNCSAGGYGWVCDIDGAEVSLTGREDGTLNIEVSGWSADGKNHIFELVNGTYVPGPPLGGLENEGKKSHAPSADTPAALDAEGMKLLKQSKYEEAAGKFASASAAAPKNALFANNAGFAYYKLENYEQSIAWFKKAIEIDPSRAVAYLNLGDAYVKLNRNAEARQAYKKYLELAPNSKSAPDVKKKLDALPPSP